MRRPSCRRLAFYEGYDSVLLFVGAADVTSHLYPIMKRVSLRAVGLLAVAVVLAAVFIVCAYYPNYARKRALSQLERMKFRAEQLEGETITASALDETFLVGEEVRRVWAKDLPIFGVTTPVDSIWLALEETTQPDDQALEWIGEFPELKRIDLFGHNRVTGSGLRYLTKHKQVKELFIVNGMLRDEYLHYLAHLENVLLVDLANQPISDAGLEGIGPLTKIKELNLIGTRTRGRFLKSASYRNEIERLHLANTEMDNQGALGLLELPKLAYVDLTNCAISADTLDRLKSRGVLVEKDSARAKSYRTMKLQ